MTVVCITGMHRSGTSMVARMLNLAGLYLGPNEKIMHPGDDNPESFWENNDFVQMNDQILSAFGGAWDFPPDLPLNWTSSKKMASLRQITMEVIGQFKDRKIWGWKDPRTSLTLEYWQELIPDLKVVIVIRNPRDIFQSLSKRGYSSLIFGSRLTTYYFNNIFSATKPENRIVTHYDTFFNKPEDELLRLIEYLGLNTDPDIIKNACTAISQSMSHNHFSLEDFVYSETPLDLIESYVSLCQEAGPSFEPIFARDMETYFGLKPNASSPAFWAITLRAAKINFERSKLISDMDNEILQLKDIIGKRDLQILQFTETVSRLEEMIEKFDTQLRKKENHVFLLFNKLNEQERSIEALTNKLHKFSLSFQLNKLKQSAVAQKLIRFLRAHRATLAPAGSTREKIAREAMHWLMTKI